MSQQWSNVVINTVADLSGNASSAVIDISSYKKVFLQTLTGAGGTFNIYITSVPASVSGGASDDPEPTSWSNLVNLTDPGVVWASVVSPEFCAKWMKVTFIGTSLDSVKAVLTAQG